MPQIEMFRSDSVYELETSINEFFETHGKTITLLHVLQTQSESVLEGELNLTITITIIYEIAASVMGQLLFVQAVQTEDKKR